MELTRGEFTSTMPTTSTIQTTTQDMTHEIVQDILTDVKEFQKESESWHEFYDIHEDKEKISKSRK